MPQNERKYQDNKKREIAEIYKKIAKSRYGQTKADVQVNVPQNTARFAISCNFCCKLAKGVIKKKTKRRNCDLHDITFVLGKKHPQGTQVKGRKDH